MRVQFRATGNCATCHHELTGLVTHQAIQSRRGVKIIDPGLIVWGPCPTGCPEWKSTPATDVALTGLSELSQVLMESHPA